ncbi:MAG: DUF1573 domain-containing protein [candidate division Zixibacteria bacterium]|jgi:hypothetical protein|nr:DUF1573 domain-containing protein [candidate division Zixibacteria bacterium]
MKPASRYWVVFLLLAGTATAAPELTLPSSSFDFGYLPQNAVVSHRFLLRSTGDAVLEIKNIRLGCGCTRAPLERNTLPPGDSTWVELIFESKHYRGSLTKGAYIYANDTAASHLIGFSANVVPQPDETRPVTISPHILDISQFGAKARTELEFTIRNLSNREVKLTPIDVPDQYITLEMPDRIGASKSVTARISLTDSAIKQSFEKSFTFSVGEDRGTRFTVPIKRTIFGTDASSSAE